MPRSRSRSRSGSMGRSSTFATRPPTSQVRASSPGMLSGFGSTLAHGMAFGAGSEVAHQAVRGMMGSNHQQGSYEPQQYAQQQPQQQYAQNPCVK